MKNLYFYNGTSLIGLFEKEDKRDIKQITIELKIKLKIFYEPLLTGKNNLYFNHLNTLLDYETENTDLS